MTILINKLNIFVISHWLLPAYLSSERDDFLFLRHKNPFHLDDPKTTQFHREILKTKPFLRRVYSDWYRKQMSFFANTKSGLFLELGSGGGFIKEIFPNIITSDVLDLDSVDRLLSADRIDFPNSSLQGILMLNVFHHIQRPEAFLQEAQRTLAKGGKVVMIEPANSIFSRFIYTHFHHEPFLPSGPPQLDFSTPLSSSNQALPFIFFERDIALFREKFPGLSLLEIEYHSPFVYLLSGGFSRYPAPPLFLFRLVRFIERLCRPFHRQLGLFCTIVIQKN